MKVKLFVNIINNNQLIEIKKKTKLPINIIKNKNNPLLIFIDYDNNEKNQYNQNEINNFDFFIGIIKFLKKSKISFTIENYKNINELIKDYDLNSKISKSIKNLNKIRELYPDCESWEEEIDGKQHFFIKINKKVYNLKI